MISCEQFSSLITDYLDGFLGGKKRKQFEEHLMACESCQAKMQQIKLVQKQLREMPLVHTSPTFNIVLKSRLRQELERESFFEHIVNILFSTKAPAYGLAVLSLLFVSIFAVNRFFSTNSTEKIAANFSSQARVVAPIASQSMAVAKKKPLVEEHVRYVLDEVPASQNLQRHLGINSTDLSEYQNNQINRTSMSADSMGTAMFPSIPMGRAVSVIF